MVKKAHKRGRRWQCALVLLLLNLAILMRSPVSAATSETAADIECLALTVYFEARGEPELGKYAVAHVVMNRSRDPHFPQHICDVVREQRVIDGSCQFTWSCDGLSDVPTEVLAWQDAEAIAHAVYDGKSDDPTAGALWFHADYVSPAWSPGPSSGQRIGRHIFYRDLGAGTQVASARVKGLVVTPKLSQETLVLLREALESGAANRLKLSVQYHSRNARRRTVQIEDFAFHEGDSIAPDIKVEAIMPDGIILSFRNGLFRQFLR